MLASTDNNEMSSSKLIIVGLIIGISDFALIDMLDGIDKALSIIVRLGVLIGMVWGAVTRWDKIASQLNRWYMKLKGRK